MVTSLDIHLSKLIGEGNNLGIDFDTGLDGHAVLYVLLVDQRLAEVPLMLEGKSRYVIRNPEEKLTVIPGTGLVEVTTHQGRRLSWQQYKPKPQTAYSAENAK
ncbi:hypothetical protein HYU18_03135 [Candidatus Woesearchaeota archaeon]|nr:hypothetical protein [Candidatus Woesearchaeota archaeon]